MQLHTAARVPHLQVGCAAAPVHAIRDVAAIENLTKHLQTQKRTQLRSMQRSKQLQLYQLP
jgi:hypothetical protein